MGTTKNPFAPGTATEPPHLAGRKEQRRLISRALELIAEAPVDGRLEHAPLAPIKIIGPRGAGKTTLLGLAESEARQQGIHVIDNAQLSSLDPSSDIISDLLEGMDIRERALLWLGSLFKFRTDIGPAGVATEQKYYERQTITRVLRSRLRRHAVLLSLDEAMHYDVESLGTLLQACQRMIKQKLPLAVMMAGTPALDGKLDQAKATFAQRFQAMYIHQLSDEAVRDALRKPFLDNGVSVSDEVLDLMASWTDNYPFFIQLAGEAVWEAMQDADRKEIDLSLAQSAETAMQEKRQGYYLRVYEAIDKAGVLDYADQVVAIVEAADPPLTRVRMVTELAAANDGMSKEEARKIFNLLLDNSLVWFANDAAVRAAIPSFFKYFKAMQERNKG